MGMIFSHDVKTLLDLLGLEAEFHGIGKRGSWSALCPNPAHDDQNPSWSINQHAGDVKNGSHFCFSCGFRGGPWELASAVWGCTLREAGIRLLEVFKSHDSKIPEMFTVILKQQKRLPPRLKWPIGTTFPGKIKDWYQPAIEYLHSRGVTDEQILKYELGYSTMGSLKYRVIIPIYTCNRLCTYTARGFLPNWPIRYKMASKREAGVDSKVAIFGEKFFNSKVDIVTVAEGSFSMLALDRAGAPNPCAVLGNDLTVERAMILGQFHNFIIASDPDEAGDKLANQLIAIGRRKKVIRLKLPKSPDDMDHELLRNSVKGAMKQLLIPRQ